MTLVLLAASATLVYAAPARLLAWRAGPAAWILYLVTSWYFLELPVLWNPCVLPLPLVLFYICLIAQAVGGAALTTAAAGAALALSIDAHVVCVLLAPLFLGCIVATARRPLLGTALGAVALAVPEYASSRGALVANGALLHGFWLPAIGLLAGALAVGVALRRRVQKARPVARGRAVLVAACVYFAAVLVAMSVVTGHGLARRYLAVLVPPASILGGALLTGTVWRGGAVARPARAANAIVAIAALLLSGALARTGGRAHAAWTALDVEVLAGSLRVDGWTYRDVFRHLRGPDAQLLVAGLAADSPAPSAAQPSAPMRDDLLVTKVARRALPAEIPREWSLVDLDGDMVAVVRRAESWVDLRQLELCEATSGEAPRCATMNLLARDPDRGARGTVTQRAYPTLESAPGARSTSGATSQQAFRWTVEVLVHTSSPAHVFTLVGAPLPWTIERVDGVGFHGSLTGREVTLDGTGDAKVLFAVDVPGELAGSFRRWLPPFVETAASEMLLRTLVTSRAP